jgi:hypothetical protein
VSSSAGNRRGPGSPISAASAAGLVLAAQREPVLASLLAARVDGPRGVERVALPLEDARVDVGVLREIEVGAPV